VLSRHSIAMLLSLLQSGEHGTSTHCHIVTAEIELSVEDMVSICYHHGHKIQFGDSNEPIFNSSHTLAIILRGLMFRVINVYLC